MHLWSCSIRKCPPAKSFFTDGGSFWTNDSFPLLDIPEIDDPVAEDGVECVETYRNHKDNIVCVLLDLTMPRMDGIQAFEELTKIREDVVVVLASGYNEQSIRERFRDRAPAGFINKPYQRDVLNEMIRDVLGIE